MTSVKRAYHAPLREEQAARTRARILEAAADEFTAHGWAGTTLAGIAARAQVSPQAIHLTFGGKPALLIRTVEASVAGASDDRMLADRPAFADVYDPAATVTRRLAAFADATLEIYARSARLFLVLQEAAAADETAAQLAAEAGERRLENHRRMIGLLLPDAPEPVRAELSDVVWVLAGPGVYVDLLHRRGWPAARYREWLTAQLRHSVRAAARSFRS